jgi:hypothetical protein
MTPLEELQEQLVGKTITVDLLIELVAPKRTEWNAKVPTSETLNFSQFFHRPIRYFFSIYDGDLAYRICLQDDSTQDGKIDAYVGLIYSVLGELDGFNKPVGDFVLEKGVEILVQKRKKIKN